MLTGAKFNKGKTCPKFTANLNKIEFLSERCHGNNWTTPSRITLNLWKAQISDLRVSNSSADVNMEDRRNGKSGTTDNNNDDDNNGDDDSSDDNNGDADNNNDGLTVLET